MILLLTTLFRKIAVNWKMLVRQKLKDVCMYQKLGAGGRGKKSKLELQTAAF